jgi:hypothetical protein
MMNSETKNNRNPASVPRSQSFQTGSFLKADRAPRKAVIIIITSDPRAKKTPIPALLLLVFQLYYVYSVFIEFKKPLLISFYWKIIS